MALMPHYADIPIQSIQEFRRSTMFRKFVHAPKDEFIHLGLSRAAIGGLLYVIVRSVYQEGSERSIISNRRLPIRFPRIIRLLNVEAAL